MKISLVIPTWSEAEALRDCLPTLEQLMLDELVVVDVCEDPAACELPVSSRAHLVCCCSPNRGRQMNLGAEESTGDVLVFHHVDSCFGGEHLSALRSAMQDPSLVGGAFHRAFDERHPQLRWLEGFARLWARNGGTIYGDQTIFVRRDVFQRLGGFAEIPLMEDVEFSRRLRRAGRVALLDPPVRSSCRKHSKNGAWRTSMQNGLFLVLFRAGVSPERLHRWYYRSREEELA